LHKAISKFGGMETLLTRAITIVALTCVLVVGAAAAVAVVGERVVAVVKETDARIDVETGDGGDILRTVLNQLGMPSPWTEVGSGKNPFKMLAPNHWQVTFLATNPVQLRDGDQVRWPGDWKCSEIRQPRLRI